MKDTSHSHQLLSQLTVVLGDYYGSAQICYQLYALVKMQNPKVVVELGTGLGVSTLWISLGLQEQGEGQIWTIDDFSAFPAFIEKSSSRIFPLLKEYGVYITPNITGEQFIYTLSNHIGLIHSPTIVNQHIDLDNPRYFSGFSFSSQSIDLLFSDFDSSPWTLIKLLTHSLPKMSETSSLFIDSIPTNPPSYHLLINILNQINKGHLPKTIKDSLTKEESETVLSRKYTLIDLTYNPTGHQCGTSWIKIEPYDIYPHPIVPSMR